jgi:hypothetical protein
VHPTSTRRAFLRRAGSALIAATAAGGLLTGCSDDDESPTVDEPDAASPDESVDDALAERALRDTTRLAAIYDAVIARHRRLRPTLSGARADLQEHLDVLSGALGDTDADPGRPPAVPGSARAAERRLADVETAMVRRRRRDAVDAESGELARLLASIAASHAQRGELLGRRAKKPTAAVPPEPDAASIDSQPVAEAMNASLAGEHAAIYAYGVIGGRLDLDSPPVQAATDAVEAHRARRDGVTALIEAGGGAPVAAEPGYLLPADVVDVAAARTTAQEVEDRCGVLYAALAATATGELRAYAVDALIDSATRALDWGAPTNPFPGVVEP